MCTQRERDREFAVKSQAHKTAQEYRKFINVSRYIDTCTGIEGPASSTRSPLSSNKART